MRNNLLKISFWLSAISIICTLLINFKISRDYFESSGKDRAFFALHAVLDYIYQYYVALVGLIALVLAFLYRKNEAYTTRRLTVGAVALFSVILVFLDLWRLFVWISE